MGLKAPEPEASAKRRNGRAARKCAWRGVGRAKNLHRRLTSWRRSTNRVPATASNPGDERCASAMAVERCISGSRVRASFQQAHQKIVYRCTIPVVADANAEQIRHAVESLK